MVQQIRMPWWLELYSSLRGYNQLSNAAAKDKLRQRENSPPDIIPELVQELRRAVIRTNQHFNSRYHREGQKMGFYPSVDIFLNFMKKEVKTFSRYELRYIKHDNVEICVAWDRRKVTAIRFEPTWSQTWEGPQTILAMLNIHMDQIDLDSLPIDFSATKELEVPLGLLEKLKSFKF